MTPVEFQTLALAWLAAVTVVGFAVAGLIFKFLPIIQEIIRDVGQHGGQISTLTAQVNATPVNPTQPSSGGPPVGYNVP